MTVIESPSWSMVVCQSDFRTTWLLRATAIPFVGMVHDSNTETRLISAPSNVCGLRFTVMFIFIPFVGIIRIKFLGFNLSPARGHPFMPVTKLVKNVSLSLVFGKFNTKVR